MTHCPACRRFSQRQANGVRACVHCSAPIFYGIDAHGQATQRDCTMPLILARIVNLEAICEDITGLELGRAIFPDEMPLRSEPGRSLGLALWVLAGAAVISCFVLATLIGAWT